MPLLRYRDISGKLTTARGQRLDCLHVTEFCKTTILDSLIGKAKQQMGGIEGFSPDCLVSKATKKRNSAAEADKTVRLLVARKLDDQKIRLSNLQMDVIEQRPTGFAG